VTNRLVARLDNVGDVVLTGPAVRAVAGGGRPVTFLAGPRGADAAALLPGVAEVLVFDAPWVAFDPSPIDPRAIRTLVDRVRRHAIEEAIILTSFHQSPLPLALLLRMAGVDRIAATCVDYPGSLLDIRHPYDESLHEVEQALSLCSAAGYELPAGDDGRLALQLPRARPRDRDRRYVVVHPGASVPARALPVEPAKRAVAELAGAGYHVVVTGSASESELARHVVSTTPPTDATIRCGTTKLAELAMLIAGAQAVVCGNTGVAHLAAAVGTPVVEAFAPVVPANRWRPWQVAHVLLGILDIPCAGCRARVCPIPDQPCLEPFTAQNVLDAVAQLSGSVGDTNGTFHGAVT
jgi:ADP-heptose:LPS heptosyltransferase